MIGTNEFKEREMDVISCSKFLSFVLRHKPQEIGITLDEAGWVGIYELLHKAKSKGIVISIELLKKVVAENNKKRFEFSTDQTKIRASQGHSVKVELGYEHTVPPKFLYHGTCERFVDSILQEGIQKMSRHHVHLSDNINTAKQVGSRHGDVFVFVVKAAEMHKHGFAFFKSTNGVWLVDHVPSEYIV